MEKLSLDTEDSNTDKLKNIRTYEKTGSVKIPKMKIVKELHSDTRTSPVYLVDYKTENKKIKSGYEK